MTSKVISASLIYHPILYIINNFYNICLNLKKNKIKYNKLSIITNQVNIDKPIIYNYTSIYFKNNYRNFSLSTKNEKLISFFCGRELNLKTLKKEKFFKKIKIDITILLLKSLYTSYNNYSDYEIFYNYHFLVYKKPMLINFKELKIITVFFFKNFVDSFFKYNVFILKTNQNKLKKIKSIKKNIKKKQLKNKQTNYLYVNVKFMHIKKHYKQFFHELFNVF